MVRFGATSNETDGNWESRNAVLHRKYSTLSRSAPEPLERRLRDHRVEDHEALDRPHQRTGLRLRLLGSPMIE
jgi:hypothetical protein